jgi:hypothetical protein
VADVRRTGHLLGDPADRDDAAPARDRVEEPSGSLHLDARRPPVGVRPTGLVWMRRDDVPEQDVAFNPELGKRGVDDRRGRLGRPVAGQLPLRGERDPADPGAAVPRCFADQNDRRIPFSLEVVL